VREHDLDRILRDILARLGVEVRVEPMEFGSGGFCRLDDEPLIVLSPGLPLSKRIEFYLEALRRLDTSGVYLPPAIRDRLEEGGSDPDIS
jgi:hypothetical protein